MTSVLTQQYRMNEIINKLANDLTYGGQLQCANDTVARATLILPKVHTTKIKWLSCMMIRHGASDLTMT